MASRQFLEPVDHRLLAELQANAEITNAALAEKVGLSPSSCLRRVQRLKEDGIILRTVALVDGEKVGQGLRAMVEVMLDHHGGPQRKAFVARLRQEPAVLSAWAVTGEPDVVLILSLRDMKDYQLLCERLFSNDANVIRFRSHFVMDSYKDETALPTEG